jgi:hypothetical protein
MVIGTAIVIIGLLAILVRLHILTMAWSFALPPLVLHLWPLLLIGTGIVLLLDREEHRMRPVRVRNGERQ